ncbi:hypothetical protein [Lampropedia puyangensis]|uniref:hypothetical protein n=1 Tax=Lampropedia puyangensis TaxID=1330072 RepID=UPI00130513BB|nr:hypothetical protein [Lampropedia puyangensis]
MEKPFGMKKSTSLTGPQHAAANHEEAVGHGGVCHEQTSNARRESAAQRFVY